MNLDVTGLHRDAALTGRVGEPVFDRPAPGRGTLDECPHGCGTACACPEQGHDPMPREERA